MKLLKSVNSPKARNNKFKKASQGTPLRFVLVVPFVLHIFGAVGLVGYLSLKNCQHTVNDLSGQLMEKVTNTVDQHLDSYLATPDQINQLNADAIKLGMLDLHNLQSVGQYFWKQMQVLNVSYISYGSVKGEFVGAGRWLEGQGVTIDEVSAQHRGQAYTYTTNNQGNRQKIVQVYDYEPRSEAWYIDTVKAGKPAWSSVYTWMAPSGVTDISISANYPIYDNAKKITGVVGIDLCLEDISKFLRSLKVSPSAKVFVIERNGLLIASSSSEKPFTVVNGKAQRLSVLNSSDSTLQATAKYLQQKFGNFEQIKNNQQLDFQINWHRLFVHVQPWRDSLGLDWLVVVVIPEDDFMAQVHANAQIILALALVTLIIATSLGLMTSNKIIQPIYRLSQASQAIANGDLDQNVEVKNINELGILSQSFNRMASQLKESFEQLEAKVKQRTAELDTAKQTAESANQAKSEFLANMSHELRTPLNAILGFAQVMNRDTSLTQQQQENLGIINRSGEHLLSLINDVLEMSKIEAGLVTLNTSSFDLHYLLNTVEEMFQLKAEAKGLQLLFEGTSEVPQYIRSDERKLRQILINLLGNAVKFTQAGGVSLRVRQSQAEEEKAETRSITSGHPTYTLCFEVEDTGSGIAADEMANLFDPFVQTETGRTSQQGTGLGLPISLKFVQLMGGDITANSVFGQGTVFQFHIQVELATSSDLPTPQAIKRVIGLEPGQQSYRILVADDRWENRQLMNRLLTPVGFEVREVGNGQDAIAVWESWQPHLIWMDMRMPIMNGYEATQKIKSHLKGQATVIIALTASSFEEEKAFILSTECDDFVRKPFREETIWEKMAQHLGVRYVYQDRQEVGSIEQEKTTSAVTLQPSSLQIMPTTWVKELQQAASQLDAELISHLITQIPSEHTVLAQLLQQKVNNFDFDQLMNLAH